VGAGLGRGSNDAARGEDLGAGVGEDQRGWTWYWPRPRELFVLAAATSRTCSSSPDPLRCPLRRPSRCREMMTILTTHVMSIAKFSMMEAEDTSYAANYDIANEGRMRMLSMLASNLLYVGTSRSCIFYDPNSVS
jgi:hypothetical protein